jgi:hypothetical protein
MSFNTSATRTITVNNGMTQGASMFLSIKVIATVDLPWYTVCALSYKSIGGETTIRYINVQTTSGQESIIDYIFIRSGAGYRVIGMTYL